MERYYFYTGHDGVQHGPFTLKQLMAESISPSTMVWYDTLDNWQSADSIVEIHAEFEKANQKNITPPPTDFAPLYKVRPPVYDRRETIIIERPKKWIIESILVTVLCCMPLGIVSLVYALRSEDQWNSGLYDAAKSSSYKAGLWVKVSLFSALIYPIALVISIIAGLLPFMFF
ncbi:MAG: CD225/dispanin family protein [Rikenellaceae bacterium]